MSGGDSAKDELVCEMYAGMYMICCVATDNFRFTGSLIGKGTLTHFL